MDLTESSSWLQIGFVQSRTCGSGFRVLKRMARLKRLHALPGAVAMEAEPVRSFI